MKGLNMVLIWVVSNKHGEDIYHVMDTERNFSFIFPFLLPEIKNEVTDLEDEIACPGVGETRDRALSAQIQASARHIFYYAMVAPLLMMW